MPLRHARAERGGLAADAEALARQLRLRRASWAARDLRRRATARSCRPHGRRSPARARAGTSPRSRRSPGGGSRRPSRAERSRSRRPPSGLRGRAEDVALRAAVAACSRAAGRQSVVAPVATGCARRAGREPSAGAPGAMTWSADSSTEGHRRCRRRSGSARRGSRRAITGAPFGPSARPADDQGARLRQVAAGTASGPGGSEPEADRLTGSSPASPSRADRGPLESRFAVAPFDGRSWPGCVSPAVEVADVDVRVRRRCRRRSRFVALVAGDDHAPAVAADHRLLRGRRRSPWRRSRRRRGWRGSCGHW